jgi:uncharacterized surface protein with fasciclin (FAS1) repeats
MSRRLLIALSALSFAAAAPAVQAQHPRSGPSIPQVAKTAGQFTTLLAAVEAAGLGEFLNGRGPITVFAPTDEAFRRLPNGTVNDLLKPENREQLRTLLSYHVVAGRVTAAEARQLSSAKTVANQDVRIRNSDGELRINDAVVRIADIPASNGLVHVIDRVLMPAPQPCNTDSRRGW